MIDEFFGAYWAISAAAARALSSAFDRDYGLRFAEVAAAVSRLEPVSPDEQVVDYGQGVMGVRARSVLSRGRMPSGPPTIDELAAAVEFAASRATDGVVMEWDCPGGSILGLEKATQTLRDVAADTVLVHWVDTRLLSGALYLAGGSGAEIIASKGSGIGSIGVMLVIEIDEAEAESSTYGNGRHSTFASRFETIVSGEEKDSEKATGAPGIAFSATQRAALKRDVDEIAEHFQQTVAEGRGIDLAEIQKLPHGRIWGPQEALGLGLVDSVGTLSMAVARVRELAAEQRRRPFMPEKNASDPKPATTAASNVPESGPPVSGTQPPSAPSMPSGSAASSGAPIALSDEMEALVSSRVPAEYRMGMRAQIREASSAGREQLLAELTSKPAYAWHREAAALAAATSTRQLKDDQRLTPAMQQAGAGELLEGLHLLELLRSEGATGDIPLQTADGKSLHSIAESVLAAAWPHNLKSSLDFDEAGTEARPSGMSTERAAELQHKYLS